MIVVIKNGLIVTAADTFKVDLLVQGGKIAEVSDGIDRKGATVIDAAGKYVMPGGVDVHTHIGLDTGVAVSSDDFFTGTRAAVMGGTTCIVDHPGFGPAGCRLGHQIDHYHALAADNAVVDYGFHGVVQHVDDDVLADMAALTDAGVTSFKIYLTYDFKLTDDAVLKVLRQLKSLGVLTAVHAENDGIVRFLREKFLREEKRAPIWHAMSRPACCEAEAVRRMIRLAGQAGDAPLYIVHLSTALGLAAVDEALEQGRPVYAETCPQYLLLSEKRYKSKDDGGWRYIMSPPLRSAMNRDALWQGVADGRIQVVATDHCAFDLALKHQLAKGDFSKAPGGIPGVELRMPLIFSEGVMKERISVNRFVDATATAPARIMGLYPRKGAIEVGADADLVVMDPEQEVTVSKSLLHENVDYTPYEGFKIRGWPVATLVRGEILARDGKFLGRKGFGKFLKRRRMDSLNQDSISV